MGKNQIVLGTMDAGVPLDRLGLRSGRLFLSSSLAADALGIDTMEVEHDFAYTAPTVFRPVGSSTLRTADGKLFGVQPEVRRLMADPSAYNYGHIVSYARDNALFWKGYLKKMPPVRKSIYDVCCQSAIGILEDAEDHYGGIYNGVAVSVLLDDIIGGLVPYTLDPALANEEVYGWLPKASRRSNLHQLVFAIGASVFKDENGDMYIGVLDPNAGYAEIPAKRIYTSGSSKSEASVVSRVTVLEHRYLALGTEEETVLFDGEVPADTVLSPVREPEYVEPNRPLPNPIPWGVKVGAMVVFKEPMHNLRVEGSEILVAGANYAILAPSGACTLYGRPYTHTTRQVTRSAPAVSGVAAVGGKTVTVKEATLVSLVNSENVADRVFAYYNGAKTVKVNMVVESERPGDKVAFTDAEGNRVEGIIGSMDITMSNTLKGAVEVVTGYTPTGIGNSYRHSVLITQNTTWTVPAGVTRIRLVLIGGGTGGSSGYPGADGTGQRMGTSSYTGGKGGAGGLGGAGGQGGKILVVTLDVTPGQVLTFNIGKGGIGGVCDGNGSVAGSEGGATTCGIYTSADGAASPIGYVDLLGKLTYATPGYDNPVAGCKGAGSDGPGERITVNDVVYGPGDQGNGSSLTGSGWEAHAGGGYGGGAAYGSSGAAGKNGSTRSNNGHGFATGGKGGDGADGAAGDNAQIPGAGGDGGYGGGGGGGGGYAYHTHANYSDPGDGGKGGLGGDGGDGADGAGLIFF